MRDEFKSETLEEDRECYDFWDEVAGDGNGDCCGVRDDFWEVWNNDIGWVSGCGCVFIFEWWFLPNCPSSSSSYIFQLCRGSLITLFNYYCCGGLLFVKFYASFC